MGRNIFFYLAIKTDPKPLKYRLKNEKLKDKHNIPEFGWGKILGQNIYS